MDVIIAGAGSIGLLLGSFLSEAGMDVTFYVRREEQANSFAEKEFNVLIKTILQTYCMRHATTDITKFLGYSTLDCCGQICRSS